jgi:hypothetical protein
VNVPMEVAYSVKQITTPTIHRERAREYIGQVSLNPSDPVGTTVLFMMNPLTLAGTRLQRIASCYQKFRFRRLALTLQSSTTTSTNGLYVFGYCSNPDAEFTPASAVPFVYDLPGSDSCNVWRTCTSTALLRDGAKWFTLDADSREVINTTQGYFVIAMQVPPSSTGPVVFPVLLDYDIELTGSARGELNVSNYSIFPAGSFAYNSVTGNFTFTAESGEPALPSLTNYTAYVVNPSWPVVVSDPTSVDDIPLNIGVIVPTLASWNFYVTLDDAALNTPIALIHNFSVGRSTVQPANSGN